VSAFYVLIKNVTVRHVGRNRTWKRSIGSEGKRVDRTLGKREGAGQGIFPREEGRKLSCAKQRLL
jgi:hypothetical protein